MILRIWAITREGAFSPRLAINIPKATVKNLKENFSREGVGGVAVTVEDRDQNSTLPIWSLVGKETLVSAALRNLCYPSRVSSDLFEVWENGDEIKTRTQDQPICQALDSETLGGCSSAH